MEINLGLLAITLVAYLAAAALYQAYLVKRQVRLGEWATRWTEVAWALHTLSLAVRWVEAGHPPLTNLFEGLSVYAWLLVLIYLIIERKYSQRAIGSFVTPLALLLVGMALVVARGTRPLPEELRSYWLGPHVIVAFLSYACFTIAFATAIIYLLQERALKKRKLGGLFFRLPPLQTTERLSHVFVAVGFPLVTLTIITGALWSSIAWEEYWIWEYKQTGAAVTWIVYAGYLFMRNLADWRDKRSAWLAILGFATVIIAYLGASVILPGEHDFYFS